jgi:hypothetical protein
MIENKLIALPLRSLHLGGLGWSGVRYRRDAERAEAAQRVRKLALIVSILLASTNASAQGFPFDDFLPRTLKEIIDQNIATQQNTKKDVKFPTQIIIDADPLPSVIRWSTPAGPVQWVNRDSII